MTLFCSPTHSLGNFPFFWMPSLKPTLSYGIWKRKCKWPGTCAMCITIKNWGQELSFYSLLYSSSELCKLVLMFYTSAIFCSVFCSPDKLMGQITQSLFCFLVKVWPTCLQPMYFLLLTPVSTILCICGRFVKRFCACGQSRQL